MGLAVALAACSGQERPSAHEAAPASAGPAAQTKPGSAARDTGFHFVLHRRQSGVVDSVFVTRAGRRVQALVPSELEEHALLDDPTYRVDLDFDGHLDFALVTLVPAAPNPAYDYWRYDPAAGRFRYVGNYQMFTPDSATRTLYTHARLGYAGKSWTNSRWGWQNGALLEIWRNEQVPADGDGDRWIYRESELRGGRWEVVKADTMESCEAEPIDEEECDVQPDGHPLPPAVYRRP